MNEPAPTFSFGENWTSYLSHADASAFEGARADIITWLGEKGVSGKRILDLGSGSGIHSSCMHFLGARELVSVDLDPKSVSATRSLWERAGRPASWTVVQGSALDRPFIESLGQFDIVYSWGVLHHTGAMWTAIENAAVAVASGGLFWITLYTKGENYPVHHELKRRYNRASPLGKWFMLRREIVRRMYWRFRAYQNPFTWNHRVTRGMDVYHDLVDWLGGLPYEVASANEVVRWARQRGFILEQIEARGEGGCSSYIFSRI